MGNDTITYIYKWLIKKCFTGIFLFSCMLYQSILLFFFFKNIFNTCSNILLLVGIMLFRFLSALTFIFFDTYIVVQILMYIASLLHDVLLTRLFIKALYEKYTILCFILCSFILL